MAGHKHPGNKEGREEWDPGSGEGETPGGEGFQLDSGSEAFRHDGTSRNSPVLLCRNSVLLLPFFPFCSQSCPMLKSMPDTGRGGVPRKPASSSFCWASLRVFLHYSLLSCFEWEDPHVIPNRSMPFMLQKSPSFPSPSLFFHPPSTHCWSQFFIFVCIYLEFTYEY